MSMGILGGWGRKCGRLGRRWGRGLVLRVMLVVFTHGSWYFVMCLIGCDFEC